MEKDVQIVRGAKIINLARNSKILDLTANQVELRID